MFETDCMGSSYMAIFVAYYGMLIDISKVMIVDIQLYE